MARDTAGAALSVRNLVWGTNSRRRIIEDIGFEVAPGEMLAVVGPNGAGKSSLLGCLFRVHPPLTGTVLLDGKDIWRMRPRAVACKVAAVLQQPPGDFAFSVRRW